MKVLVFAKQIPDINKIGFDPATNRIVRENVPLQINPFDRKAVEEAIRIKEKYGFETAVATMGPPPSAEIINQSMMMGIDQGFLITDRIFGGSDTLVTSRILASFVSMYKPDLILMGKYSLDGETSQVPPELAKLCGYGFKSSVSRLEIDGTTCTVDQDLERSIATYRLELPAVISVSEKINRARAVKQGTPDMSSRIEMLDSRKLGITISGSKDSPTVVSGTERVESMRKVKFLQPGKESYDEILQIIGQQNTVQEDTISLEQERNGEMVLGIAVSDSAVSMQIASKNAELASGTGLSATVIGNINPSELKGMPSHRYIFLKEYHTACFSDFLSRFISEHKPKFVVFPSTVEGREIAAFVAADLGLGLTADCIDLKFENNRLIQYKPAFGGGIVARIESRTEPAMATIRPGIFRRHVSKSAFTLEDADCECRRADEKISEVMIPSEYKTLSDSRVVIGIGKGIRRPDNVKLAIKLAEDLGASLGATRPVVDFGWVPRQQQIGLTGISISPEVYIAVGISGHDNHIVGTRYAGKIIAVNTDANAPIFQYSDYGIIADAAEFMTGFSEYLASK